MNRIFTTIVGLIFITPVLAQWNVYHPFPESGGEWNVMHQGYECSYCYDRYFFMEGDTTINNYNYSKINYKGWTAPYDYTAGNCWNWAYSSIVHYHGALRQDTSLKTVYFVPSGSDTEGLLYDFSLNAGDPLPSGINNPFGAVIETVDLVMIDGTPRKRFKLAHDGIYFDVYIIEGIGSTTGLTEWFLNFECGSWLYCYSEDNFRLFPDPPGGICNLTVGAEENVEIPEINIFPNPSQGLFSFVSDIKPVSVGFISILGQEVYNMFPDSGIFSADLRNLPEGLYFCHMIFANNTEKYVKLIISR